MPGEIFAASGTAVGLRAAGRHVLAIQDTTHLSFPRRAGGGLGPGGNGEVPALFVHPVLALDAADGTALGVAAGRVWTRGSEKVLPRRSRSLAEKESARWIEEGAAAKTALSSARQVTLIADRESDIYEEWVTLPGLGFDLITRASRDRKLVGEQRLFTVAKVWPVAAHRELEVPVRKSRPARQATLALKYGPVSLCHPRHCSTSGLPKTLTLQLVEVQELDPPEGVQAIHWRLLTTHQVESAEEAWQIVDWYRGRWRIEEYFRVLKKSGIDLEEAMVEGVHALTNLVAMAAVAGVAVMQLVEGREAGPERRASEVITLQEITLRPSPEPHARGQDRKAEEPSSGRLPRLARLDRRTSWRLERLSALRTRRAQNHGLRMAPVQNHDPRMAAQSNCVNLLDG